MTIRRLLCLILAVTLPAACASPRKTDMHHETIFTGSSLFDGSRGTGFSRGDVGVYVADGLVREVGAGSQLRAAHPAARVIDARGATILPGLTDAHGHLYGLGLSLDVVPLAGTPSYEEVVSRTAARAATASGGEWVLGRGWDQNDWPVKEFPTAVALDAAVLDHPVWLKRVDGHAGLANSAAMRAAGITAATKDPEGGRILRDAAGAPTGVFVDEAMGLVEEKIPAASYELRKKRVLAAAREIARNGLTEMHDAGADDDTIRAVKELIDEKLFPIRVYAMLTDEPRLLEKYLAAGPIVGYGGRLTVRSIKLYADGALGSRGAALLAPYSDEPDNSGLLIAKRQHIEDVARRARERGFQVNTHAIGDRGVANVVDGYEAAGVGPADRFRIEHFQVVAPADFERVARRGIIASMQPTHATSDMPWAERRIGPERVRGAYAWRRVLDSGARLALGSDFPVEDVNPFFGIYSAVTRQDHEGHPPEGWVPAERLSLAEAVRGFTEWAAFAAFEESSRGSIAPGNVADFTIVEGDLSAAPSSELWKTRVRYTVVGGEVVFAAK